MSAKLQQALFDEADLRMRQSKTLVRLGELYVLIDRLPDGDDRTLALDEIRDCLHELDGYRLEYARGKGKAM